MTMIMVAEAGTTGTPVSAYGTARRKRKPFRESNPTQNPFMSRR